MNERCRGWEFILITDGQYYNKLSQRQDIMSKLYLFTGTYSLAPILFQAFLFFVIPFIFYLIFPITVTNIIIIYNVYILAIIVQVLLLVQGHTE